MKTSRFQRRSELQTLEFKAANGQMYHKEDINRLLVLRNQFSSLPSLANSDLKPSKVLDNQ